MVQISAKMRPAKLVDGQDSSTQDVPEAVEKVWYGPEIELKTEWSSLGHYLLHKMENDNANKLVITDFASGRQYTGLQLREKVLAVACALIDEYDFKPATMVTLAYDNSDHSIIVALAVLVAGGAVSGYDYRDPYAELLNLGKKVEPRFLFCHSRNLNWAKQLSTDLGFEVVGIPMDEPANYNGSSSSWFGDFFEYNYKTKSESLNKLPVPTVKPLDKQVALITMSSGTTGKSKAVAHSHWSCIADLAPERRARFDNSSAACVAPLDYITGRIIIFGAINNGYNVVILRGFDQISLLQAIEKYRLRVLYLGVASLYSFITYGDLDKYDISSLRCIFSAGAKVQYLDKLRDFLTKHPHIVSLLPTYAASETSVICMATRCPEEYLNDGENSGRLAAGLQAKIVDRDTSHKLGPNEQGMMCVRGETVFPGYYDMEQARREGARIGLKLADVNPLCGGESVFDSEGYYITGDVASFNSRGEIYVVGRQKELMKCFDSKRVFPQELEEVIGKHPFVSSVCVLGIQSKLRPTDHCPRAFVVIKPDYYAMTTEELRLLRSKIELADHQELETDNKCEQLKHVGEHKLCKMGTEKRRMIAEDLMEFVNERVGWYKQLTGGVVILDEIPVSRSTGKMNKNFLRALELDQIEIYGDRSK